MRKEIIRSIYAKADISAAAELLELTAGNQAKAATLLAKFNVELDREGDYDYFSELPIIWLLAPFSGFYVDWKNVESFCGFVEQLAADWGLSGFSFPADLLNEGGEPANIPESMLWACQELAKHDLLLWHWNTEEDNFCGYITRECNWPAVVRLCAKLEIAALRGDAQF